jgi:hypothetical protein
VEDPRCHSQAPIEQAPGSIDFNKEKPTLKNNNLLMQVIAAAVACLVVASSGYAQQLDKGSIETTGQVGIATGIGTQASFAGTIGTAVTSKVFVLGEFGWIPLGGANASGSTPGGSFELSTGGKVLSFMAGAQYQFNETRSFVPYAGAALGLVHASADFESSVPGSAQNVHVSSNNFYVSFGGGARYYVKDRWGFKPEFMVFAGEDTFFRFGAGIFYQFGR